MLEDTQDHEEIIERVAALDIGKAEVVCCVRVPSPRTPGRRAQEITTYSTMTRSLVEAGRPAARAGRDPGGHGSHVGLLEAACSTCWRRTGLDPWLVNARDVKHLPGRPKTDKLDAVWLCKVAERQMLRPSFVPPPDRSASCGT